MRIIRKSHLVFPWVFLPGIGRRRPITEFGQEILDGELKKVEAGVSTPYNLSVAEQGLFSAQLALVQVQTAYAKALVAKEHVMGTLLESGNVSLENMLQAK